MRVAGLAAINGWFMEDCEVDKTYLQDLKDSDIRQGFGKKKEIEH
jgi:hypothetical protein